MKVYVKVIKTIKNRLKCPQFVLNTKVIIIKSSVNH